MDRSKQPKVLPPAPFTSDKNRIPLPAPSPCRFIRPPLIFRKKSGSTKDTSIREFRIPRATRLEENLAALEGGVASRVFASGMAAINAIVRCSSPVITWLRDTTSTAECRGLFNQVFADFGMEFTYVDTSDAKNVERAIRKNTRMVYIETPTNPLMASRDHSRDQRICRVKKVELVVDNTFMSPYFQQPIALGADMVVHSIETGTANHLAQATGFGGQVIGPPRWYARLPRWPARAAATPVSKGAFGSLRVLTHSKKFSM